MANNIKDTNNTILEDVYTYCSGIGSARIPVVKQLNEGNTVPVKLIPKHDSGRVEVMTMAGQKVGYIMSSSENSFAMLKKREPATNTIFDDTEILARLGNTEVEAVAINAASVSVIKIRLDASQMQEAEVAAPVVEEIEEEVSLGDFSKHNQEEMKKRINYLKKECKFSSTKSRNKVIAAYVNYMQTCKELPEFNPTFVNNNHIVEDAIMNVLAGNNILLNGPAGVGKNVLVLFLANFFGKNLVDTSVTYDTGKEDFLGSPTINEDGKVEFLISRIVQAFIDGDWFNIDEGNMGRQAVMALFHSVLDHRRYIEVPGYDLVKVHPETRFFMTMNEGEGYEGTRQLNTAFRDRFHEIIFKPNPDGMKKVFAKNCDLDDKEAETLFKYYKLIYAAVYNSDSDACIPAEYLSQRKFVRAGQLYSMGFVSTIEEAFRKEVIDTIADLEIRGIIENLVLINC